MAAPTTTIEEMSKSALEQIKGLLDKILRITTNDGRIFIGTFAGTDKPLNLILLNTEEFRISGPDSKVAGRFIGQVIFPWKIVTKVEARIELEVTGNQPADNGWYFW
jgi:small nuclear ribonucleoprotein (snRNP)-like protein